jgi:hypothetical protein
MNSDNTTPAPFTVRAFSGDEPGVPVKVNPHVPELVWTDESGAAKAAACADYFDGKFQFLIYGREEMDGGDGYIAVTFDEDGQIKSVEVQDFRRLVTVNHDME